MNWKFFRTIGENKKGIAFLLLAAVILFAFGLQKETSVETHVLPGKPAPTPKISPTPIPTTLLQKMSPTAVAEEPTPTPASIIIEITTSQQQSSTQVAQPVVHVSVSGGNSFDLQIASDANQCDVLTKAQADGKISDLSMKFDSSLGSYGVYKINGLGKDNAVWWTYSVNGQDPPKGCSFIKANNDDHIVWKYIGS